MGRLDTVTNDRFQVSELNDSFLAMNLKSGRSPGDPQVTISPTKKIHPKETLKRVASLINGFDRPGTVMELFFIE